MMSFLIVKSLPNDDIDPRNNNDTQKEFIPAYIFTVNQNHLRKTFFESWNQVGADLVCCNRYQSDESAKHILLNSLDGKPLFGTQLIKFGPRAVILKPGTRTVLRLAY